MDNYFSNTLVVVETMYLLRSNAIFSKQLRLFASVECDQDVVNSENPPASFLLLSTAHEWLGEKSEL